MVYGKTCVMSRQLDSTTHEAGVNLSVIGPVEIVPNAIYTTNEAAAACRVQPARIQRAVRLGEIRGAGRPFRILGSELFKLAGGVAS